jgi:hypothetical protein
MYLQSLARKDGVVLIKHRIVVKEEEVLFVSMAVYYTARNCSGSGHCNGVSCDGANVDERLRS